MVAPSHRTAWRGPRWGRRQGRKHVLLSGGEKPFLSVARGVETCLDLWPRRTLGSGRSGGPFCCLLPLSGHRYMSYYQNGPRIFTPSTLKQSKTFMPVESFGSTMEQELRHLGEEPPVVNTCHRSRFANLQHTHPSACVPSTPAVC